MSLRNTPKLVNIAAGADLSALQYTAVKFGSSDPTTCVSSTSQSDTGIIGILQNAPKSGETASIAVPGGGAYFIASTSISLGATLTPTTGGQAVTDTTAAHRILAEAWEAATAQNDVIEVMVVDYFYHA